MAQADPAAYDLMFNGCDMASSPTLQQVAPLSFLRLSAAVAAARAHVGLSDDDDATERDDANARTDAFILWEAVHGFAMLRLSGQFEAFGIVPEVHLEHVLHRLSNLFR